MTRRRHFRRMCREAGSEVANDLGEMFVRACKEVGLKITDATYLKPRKSDVWCVVVLAKHPDWDDERWSSLSIEGWVPSTGDWPDCLKIGCMVPAHHGLLPVRMDGRSSIKPTELIGALQQTIREREVVVQRIRAGDGGPFQFEHASWRLRNYLEGLPI